MNKNINLLAAAMLTASSAHAAFDEGNAVLFAYDQADDDTYFVDLGVTGQDLVSGATVYFADAGLATFLANNAGAQWTIIASVNDTVNVVGPPAAGASLANSGVVGTSLSGSAVGNDGTTNDQQRIIMNDWLAQVQAASAGASSFGVAGTDPSSADAARNGGFFNNSLIAVGDGALTYYSRANPNDGSSIADPNVVTQLGYHVDFPVDPNYGYSAGSAHLDTSGTIQINAICLGNWSPYCAPPPSAVPIPATAWLFGSSLIGLALARRRKHA